MKSDARVRYTRMRIKEAFFVLLEKEAFSKITVTDICNLAEINRATFYKHYLDPADLLQKLEEEILDTMHSTIQNLIYKNNIELLESLLLNLQNSKSIPVYHIFKADSEFSNRISDTFYEEMCQHFNNNLGSYSPDECEMAFRFVVNGCASIIRYWIISGMKQPAHQIAKLICTVSEKALK